MKSLVAAISLASTICANATVVTLDFGQFLGGHYGGTLESNGFVLDPGTIGPAAGHYHIVEPTDAYLGFANNGTNVFVFDYFNTNTFLNVYGSTGGVFGVKQLDVGEAYFLTGAQAGTCAAWPANRGPYVVKFTGHLAGGGTITRSESLDMICDGAGPQNDFQTFGFDGSWDQLTLLTIQQLNMFDTPESNVAIDNLVLRAAPEPSTYALMLTGIGALGLVGRRRRSIAA